MLQTKRMSHTHQISINLKCYTCRKESIVHGALISVSCPVSFTCPCCNERVTIPFVKPKHLEQSLIRIGSHQLTYASYCRPVKGYNTRYLDI